MLDSFSVWGLQVPDVPKGAPPVSPGSNQSNVGNKGAEAKMNGCKQTRFKKNLFVDDDAAAAAAADDDDDDDDDDDYDDDDDDDDDAISDTFPVTAHL